VARDVVNSCERAVVYLLRAAYLVKLNHFHRLGIVEIAERRINEGQMTILADAKHGKVGRVSCEQFAITFGFPRSILRIALQPMKFAHRHFVNKTIHEKTSEGLWRPIVHAEILIEMETNNSRPINAGGFDKRRQKFILRRRGREDPDRPAARFD
jgi:hypothetical protein